MTAGCWNRSLSQSRLAGLFRRIAGHIAASRSDAVLFAWGRKIVSRSFPARIDERISGWPGISRFTPLTRALESHWGVWLLAGSPAIALLMPPAAGVMWTAAVLAAVALSSGTGKAVSGLPVWLCSLAAASLIPVALSQLPARSFIIWVQWVVLLAIAVLAAAAIPRLERRRFGMALSWLAVWMGVLACAQAALGWGDVTGWVAPRLRPSMPFRATGFFGNPNVFGAVINLVLWPLLFEESERANPGRILRTFGALALTVALLLTRSRAALLGALFALVFWLSTKCRRRLPIIAFAVGVFGMFLASGERVFGIHAVAEATATRWHIWRTALQLFAARPLFGQGPGSFAELAASSFAQPDHAHNVILQFLAENGLAGTVPVVCFFGRLGRRVIQHAKMSGGRQSNGFLVGIGAALAAVGVQSLFDYPLASCTVALLVWVWIGFAWGATGSSERIVPGEV